MSDGGVIWTKYGHVLENTAENGRLRAQGEMGALIDENAALIARAEAAEAEVARLDRVLGGMLQAAGRDAQRIAELEAENERLKHENAAAWDSAEHNARRAERAEAALREVGELSKKWHRFGMEKHWIEWDNAPGTVFNACADELRAILAKYKEEGK
jgi:hypothetical protein